MTTISVRQTATLADRLASAAQQKRAIDSLTVSFPLLDLDDAYAVQQELTRRAVLTGAIVAGRKIGLTSEAMQNQFGVDQPDYGVLYTSMHIRDGGIAPSTLLQPKVEAEIAFRLKSPLQGEVSPDEVLRATDAVHAAIEVIDSRIRDWRITLVDTIADNASAGAYVLGPAAEVGRDLPDLRMTLEQDGVVVASGLGSAALGDPAVCVAWLARALSRHGERLEAGDVVLTGALHAAVTATPGGTFTARFDRIGSVSVTFPPADDERDPTSYQKERS